MEVYIVESVNMCVIFLGEILPLLLFCIHTKHVKHDEYKFTLILSWLFLDS